MCSMLSAALNGGGGQSQVENDLCRSHTTTVVSRIPVYLNQLEETSDVKFIFKINDEEKVIYGHKFILAMASPVFYKMFFNRYMTPVQDEVQMEQLTFSDLAFSKFIQILYMDKIGRAVCEGLPADIAIGMLSCADFYDVPYVKEEVVKYLDKILVKENVIPILEAGLMFNERDLANKCLSLIDQHSKCIFASEEMNGVKTETLFQIFKRDSLDVEEDVLLDLAMKWAESKCKLENLEGSDENKRKVLGLVFFEIRFTLLPPAKLSEIVHSGLLTQEEIVEMFLRYHESGSLKLKDNRIGRTVVFKSNHRFGLKKVADSEESREGVHPVARKFNEEEIIRLTLRSGVKISIAEADLFMIGFGDDMNAERIQGLMEYNGAEDAKVIKLGGRLGAYNVRFSYKPRYFAGTNILHPAAFDFPDTIFICEWSDRKKYAYFADDETEEIQG